MFHKVFVEKEIAQLQRTQAILSRLKPQAVDYVHRYDSIWGRVKKPYLQKRQELNLFIAKKRGQLVKPAPPAYGPAGSPHYYFIHAFNCLYECQYCYLQGYFSTPDLVFFVNYEDIFDEMTRILSLHPRSPRIWFHGGEFSDSLALASITGELASFFDFFYHHPRAGLELRTKSANLKALDSLAPADNIVVSYSLSPSDSAQELDLKAPSLKARLRAIAQLAQRDYQIAIHFDPIVESLQLEHQYDQLLGQLASALPWSQLTYLSLGVVRFTSAVHRQVSQNYPHSPLFHHPMTKSFDHKIRYSRPHRMDILSKVKSLCLRHHIPAHKIYLCMESAPPATPLA